MKRPLNTRGKLQIACLGGLLLPLMLIVSGSVAANHDDSKQSRRGPVVLSELQERMTEQFNRADSDGDGSLTAHELAQLPNKHRGGFRFKRKFKKHQTQLDQEQLEAEVFAALDQNQDGQLSPEEAAPAKRRDAMRKIFLAKHFERLDADNNGRIEQQEFNLRLDRLRAADTNQDGIVTKSERRAARQRQRS